MENFKYPIFKVQNGNTTAIALEKYGGLVVLLISDTDSIIFFSRLIYKLNLVQLLKMSVLNKEVTLMAGNKPQGSVAHHRGSLSVCSAAVQTPLTAGKEVDPHGHGL